MVSRDDLAALIADSGAQAGLTLAEWAAMTLQELAASEGPARRSAADLILADRRHRSVDTARP
jgi:hypothetical protein